MEEIIPSSRIEQYNLFNIESPLFAALTIEAALSRRYQIPGLDGLLAQCGLSMLHCLKPEDHVRILSRVKRGEWLLVTSRPFQPLSGIPMCTVADPAGPRSLLGFFSSEQELRMIKKGPGKWRTISIDLEGARSIVAFLANRITSMGDEGRPFLTEGKDYANTMRTVTQQWVPLEQHDQSFAPRLIVRSYGEIRKIKQIYVEGEDHWQVVGKSWHWRPVVADTVYEYKDGLF
ncbi:hypothetical protein JYG36_25060 [Pseudomonas sp. SORT22]|uniref:hypothetical protein n=1 Tax=Pseudomonas sp. SORT22 TaxID=2813842 RepID=UPI001BCEDA81|nr:hypothetical protein [Pseudomonas sp. SORT22]QVM96329.1 hypothetical protein JYG36_25060 [Pseudomonas sp. SORT22]